MNPIGYEEASAIAKAAHAAFIQARDALEAAEKNWVMARSHAWELRFNDKRKEQTS